MRGEKRGRVQEEEEDEREEEIKNRVNWRPAGLTAFTSKLPQLALAGRRQFVIEQSTTSVISQNVILGTFTKELEDLEFARPLFPIQQDGQQKICSTSKFPADVRVNSLAFVQ
ncbi:hypothetical protein PoB_002009100 [Plakobranchus ocellatus]|uniref:Uncharacterized protein n=1 Tax=Plakobranchus ocellatus TaxID=259542 RepID=A0AAV3ZCE7_9GAST|nr:hypothetical protein PoB_002009100 [Plakobranchus ocellatus]